MSLLRQRLEEISDQLCVLHDDVLQRNAPPVLPPAGATVKDALSPADACSVSSEAFSMPGLTLDSGFGTYPSSSSAMATTPLVPAAGSSYSSLSQLQPPANDVNDMGSLLDALSEHQNRVLVDCRCGVEHKSPTECLEYSTFLILLRTHENLSRSIYSTPPRLPRNPSLLSLFRHSYTSNPVIHILGSIFNRIHPVNVFTMFGIFVGMYRFLRVCRPPCSLFPTNSLKWRLYPHGQSHGDIPAWLRPTHIQKSIPHPVSIDFLPWPGLRDYLTTHQNEDPRHSVNLYIRSVRFRWPENRTFYSTTPRGEISLNLDFVQELNKYENWMLSVEWARMFPHLAQYVNVEEGYVNTSTTTSRDTSVQTD